MDINHLCESTTQKDELAKAFIKSIEKISGVKVLDTQLYTDFTLRIKPTGENFRADTVSHIELTEEQF